MESERVLKSIKLLVAIAILTVIVFIANLIINRKNGISDFLANIAPEKRIQDSYNGVYTYEEDLGYKISAFTGCSLDSVNNHILIVNEDYYLFRSSCMGTYLIEKGETDNLNIVETDKAYLVKYKGNQYNRDYKVVNIATNNRIEKQKGTLLDLNSLPGIIKETMEYGNYYQFNRMVSGINVEIKVVLEHIDGNNYNLIFKSGNDTIYTYSITNPDKMPLYYGYGANLVMLERESSAAKYSYRFRVLSEGGVVYDLKDSLPIKIDGVNLDYNNSIFIIYDSNVRQFKMFVGSDKKFCVSGGDSDKVAYYEFKIDYNYNTNRFEKPTFVKVWYENEGCSYIEQYLKEAV